MKQPLVNEKFEWKSGVETPEMYPVRTHNSILIYEDGYTPLISGIATRGDWTGPGNQDSDMERKPIPYRLVINWLSCVEEKFYFGVFDLPQEKIAELFRNGYISGKSKEKRDYQNIVVGLAPGGLVTVWIWGSESCVEVACFHVEEGRKIPVKELAPNSDIETPEEFASRLWMSYKDIVEYFETHEKDFSIWSRYRNKYLYDIEVDFIDDGIGIIDFIRLHYLNAEVDNIFGEQLNSSLLNYRPQVNEIRTAWSCNENIFEASIELDEEELTEILNQIVKEDTDKFKLTIQIAPDNYIEVFIRSIDEDLPYEFKLKKADIGWWELKDYNKKYFSVFKSNKL